MDRAIRLDKWLWHARVFKSRSLAAKACQGGRVRINGSAVAKASATLRVGDVITLPQGDRIRVLEVLELGTRRGPAAEASTLYSDLSPRPDPETPRLRQPGQRTPGSGRPTKAERRALDRFRAGE